MAVHANSAGGACHVFVELASEAVGCECVWGGGVD
jgi:hypothetical protein